MISASRTIGPRSARVVALVAIVCACAPSTGDDAARGSALVSIGSDPHHGGRARELGVAVLAFGRLVDLFAEDPASGERVPVATDVVIDPRIDSDGIEYRLEPALATGALELTVLHPAGSLLFEHAVERLEAGLVAVPLETFAASALPPFAAIPRDAALVVRLDDLFDPASLGPDSIRIEAGESALERHPVRVLADPRHGAWLDRDGDGVRELASTRVIVDLAVTAEDAARSAAPLELSPAGLPAASDPSRPSLCVRFAEAGYPAGASSAVRNLEGAQLAAGSTELAFTLRSSGAQAGDPDSGYLGLAAPLRILGNQDVAITQATALGGDLWRVDFDYATDVCAVGVLKRDVLEQGGWIGVAVRASGAPAQGAIAGAVYQLPVGGSLAIGAARAITAWDPRKGAPPACFVTVVPDPVAPPARGIDTAATFLIEFDQPVAPASLDPFETFALSRDDLPPLARTVVANVVGTVSGSGAALIPVVDLPHVAGEGEVVRLSVADGPNGITSLAGGELAFDLPDVSFSMNPGAASQLTGGRSLSFTSIDEDVIFPFDTPEVAGQFLYDFAQGSVRPRPVTRFSGVADASQPIVAAMATFGAGVQTPLVPLGSKLMSLWRYCDLGFGLTDTSTANIDVEALAWAPIGASAVADTFPEFQMALAHSKFQPDEFINPQSLLPSYPSSGTHPIFAFNLLDATNDPGTIVHAKSAGYTVDPSDAFTSPTGTVMQPWPMNQGVPVDQRVYYTWRDTAITAVGAPFGVGAEIARLVQVTGNGTPGVPYPANLVPSVGLPLLIEYRCYPSASSLGLNSFKVAFALNSSAAPYFRAFSSGGVHQSGQTKTVDPDNEPTATGGVDPGTGQPTAPRDNVFYIGQADFVVRVSRMITVWMDTGFAAPTYVEPVIAPNAALQPAGTLVIVAMRGASALTPPPSGSNAGSWANALNYDLYGDSLKSIPGQFFATSANLAFTQDPAQIQGAQFVQMRVTFISNAATGETAELAGVGIPFTD